MYIIVSILSEDDHQPADVGIFPYNIHVIFIYIIAVSFISMLCSFHALTHGTGIPRSAIAPAESLCLFGMLCIVIADPKQDFHEPTSCWRSRVLRVAVLVSFCWGENGEKPSV